MIWLTVLGRGLHFCKVGEERNMDCKRKLSQIKEYHGETVVYAERLCYSLKKNESNLVICQDDF